MSRKEEDFKEWCHKWFGKWSENPPERYYAYYRKIWEDARRVNDKNTETPEIETQPITVRTVKDPPQTVTFHTVKDVPETTTITLHIETRTVSLWPEGRPLPSHD